jgi:hypothetical protein
LIINYDQTGVYIRPAQGSTFAPRGSKQVDVIGKDEKRAYTLGVLTTPNGTALPFESIWSGKSKASLPSEKAAGYAEAEQLGFHFAFAASEKRTSHFSTLKTMKELFRTVIQPYIQAVIAADPDLDEDQKAILYYDLYPVHASEAMRTFVFDEFPNIIIILSPAIAPGFSSPRTSVSNGSQSTNSSRVCFSIKSTAIRLRSQLGLPQRM